MSDKLETTKDAKIKNPRLKHSDGKSCVWSALILTEGVGQGSRRGKNEEGDGGMIKKSKTPKLLLQHN